MYDKLEQRLKRFLNSGASHVLQEGCVGLEKESLRVSPEGTISQTPHPRALGSPLTHPFITTDYSEALIEFITPAFQGMGEALKFLSETQKFVYDNLDDEILWATSMPCVIRGETSIPIAQYGTSNAGIMKTVYRRGLGYRYGRYMQVIAGVHFNYSFGDRFWQLYQDLERDVREPKAFVSDAYFALIRNLQRFGWIVPYLFGASPAICKTFLNGQPTTLEKFSDYSLYQPFATSLRMGDIGYQNNKEKETGIKASYDSLDSYVESLVRAIKTPYPGYEKIGVVVDGEYRQLNANLLQIENEYYSTIRPKQIPIDLEMPILALRRRGVAYVELRSLDVNAFDPLGLNEEQLRFLEAFLIFCLLHDSPPLTDTERGEIDYNEITAAHRGRDPTLELRRDGRPQLLREWAVELCDAMIGVCDTLDQDRPERPYGRALAAQREAVRDPDRTPSARMLAEMRHGEEEFFGFARRMSERYREYFASFELPDERRRYFEQLARQSLERQRDIEAADDVGFDEFLRRYFAQV